MHVLEVTNVNQAVAKAIPYLLKNGIRETSRNGTVLVAPGPVTTVYTRPWERVLFSPIRDANPFFHLMESLWMMAGRNDIAFPKYFNKRFGEYSDDGVTQHGAYGHRWRHAFGRDQLVMIAAELEKNPDSRRCVLTMWDPSIPDTQFEDGTTPDPDQHKNDLWVAMNGGRDVPCNTHAYLDVRGGKLNLTVCCRSNDVIWGAYGANSVHFSVLHSYMAALLGVPPGVYRQMSNNFHVYTDVYDEAKLAEMATEAAATDYYQLPEMKAYPLFQKGGAEGIASWDQDNEDFLDIGDDVEPGSSNPFFDDIAKFMLVAWRQRKEGGGNGAEFIDLMPECDWKLACMNWITRREEKAYEKT